MLSFDLPSPARYLDPGDRPDTRTHCQVLDKLGAGGMGELYRARDTRLGVTLPSRFCRPQEIHMSLDRPPGSTTARWWRRGWSQKHQSTGFSEDAREGSSTRMPPESESEPKCSRQTQLRGDAPEAPQSMRWEWLECRCHTGGVRGSSGAEAAGGKKIQARRNPSSVTGRSMIGSRRRTFAFCVGALLSNMV